MSQGEIVWSAPANIRYYPAYLNGQWQWQTTEYTVTVDSEKLDLAPYGGKSMNVQISDAVGNSLRAVSAKTGKSIHEVAEYLLRQALQIDEMSVEDAIASLKEDKTE